MSLLLVELFNVSDHHQLTEWTDTINFICVCNTNPNKDNKILKTEIVVKDLTKAGKYTFAG